MATLELGACVKSPSVRQLLEFYGAARAVAPDEGPFVDKLCREVAALRLGVSKWLVKDTEAVVIGVDTSPLAEPSVAASLYKAAYEAVGENTWGPY